MYKKVSLLSTFISVHKLDIICLSETYLNSKTSPDEDNLEIPGYNIIRKDCPSNTKRWGVCVYHKNTLPFKLINIKYLQECITFQICLYRSPSQTSDEFESFLKKLTLDKIHEDNPFMISVLGDFNAKSNNWHKNDITSYEGSMVDPVTSNYEPTHTLNFPSSCIDLISTSQPNLVMESGVHLSHLYIQFVIIFAKFNLSILYLPPYKRTVWFYKKANPELIQKAINEFDWIRAISNVSVDEKICYFTETLLNIIHNFITHERIVCDDRHPPWINNDIKKLINENSAYKSYCGFNRDVSCQKV